MQRIRRSAALLGLLILVSAMSGGCALWRPAFRAPIEQFDVQPGTTGQLEQRIAGRHPEVDRLIVRMRVVASGGPVRGNREVILHAFYREPEQVTLNASHRRLNRMFRITQAGEEAVVHLYDRGEFFRGSLSELDAHPEALYGVRPTDMIRALLAGREIVELIQSIDPATPLPNAPAKAKHWPIATDPDENRKEIYYVRKADGLVEKIGIHDAGDKRRILVSFKRYDYFGGLLFPTEFELGFDDSKLRLRIEVENVDLQTAAPDSVFSLEPPPGADLAVRPLSEFIAEETRAAEARR